MSIFLIRIKRSVFDAAQPKQDAPLVLHCKPDSSWTTAAVSTGDLAIVCTPDSKSSPAYFRVSSWHEHEPLVLSVSVLDYSADRKDAHLLQLDSGLTLWKNLRSPKNKVQSVDDAPVEESVLFSPQSVGMKFKVERSEYTLQIRSNQCTLLEEAEVVIDSDEETEMFIKIDDEDYVAAIQQLVSGKTGSTGSAASQSGNAATPADASGAAAAAPSESASNSQEQDANNTNDTTMSEAHANGHATNAKAEDDEGDDEAPKKKQRLDSSTPSTPNNNNNNNNKGSPDGTDAINTTPGREVSAVDLLKHVAQVAGMMKEMDTEHSERISKLEEEVERMKARMDGRPFMPPSLHNTIATSSASHTTSSSSKDATGDAKEGIVVRKRGRPPKQHHHHTPQQHHHPVHHFAQPHTSHPPLPPAAHSPQLAYQPPHTPSPAPPPTQPQGVQKIQAPTLVLEAGELLAVRADPTSLERFWLARVIGHSTKRAGYVRVYWFEKFTDLPGWYFLDSKEDAVDPNAVFYRNFELLLKPHKLSSGQFIDVYKPTEDISAHENENGEQKA